MREDRIRRPEARYHFNGAAAIRRLRRAYVHARAESSDRRGTFIRSRIRVTVQPRRMNLEGPKRSAAR